MQTPRKKKVTFQIVSWIQTTLEIQLHVQAPITFVWLYMQVTNLIITYSKNMIDNFHTSDTRYLIIAIHSFSDSPGLKYALRMCSVSSRAPNGTCQNVTIPEVGERKICTCSTNMCNTAENSYYSSTYMPHILFYLQIIYLSIHTRMLYWPK